MHGTQLSDKDEMSKDYRMIKFLFMLLLLKMIDDIELANKLSDSTL